MQVADQTTEAGKRQPFSGIWPEGCQECGEPFSVRIRVNGDPWYLCLDCCNREPFRSADARDLDLLRSP